MKSSLTFNDFLDIEKADALSALLAQRKEIPLKILGKVGLALAVLVTFALPAHAQNWTGFYIGPTTAHVNFGVDWMNPGTPEQQLRGVMAGINGGFNVQLGNSPVVAGVTADAVFGNLNQCQRDGNYIVECGTLHAMGTLRGRLGVAVGPALIYGTAGVAWAHMSQNQSCPAPAAVVAGWCKTHGPYDLTGTGTLWGRVWGAGVEVRLGNEGRGSVFAEVLRSTFRPFNFGPLMGPDGDGHPNLPDQIVLGAATTIQIGFRWRF